MHRIMARKEMVSDKLESILQSKTDLSSEQIQTLSEEEGWHIVYSLPKKEKLPQICFTGFSNSVKEDLQRRARESGKFQVVASATKHLEILCAGENAGPAKLEKAKVAGAAIVDQEGFEKLIEFGEISEC